MNNFGVIEVASAKTTNAPGWAYVPDRQQHHHLLPNTGPAPTSNRKRARAAAGGAPLSLADASARQEAKSRREIEILDRDNARDVQIAIPPKPRGGGGGGGISRTGGKKYTPNVRKILQSQKTFANHLDDYVALLSQQQQQEANPNINNSGGGGGGGGTPASGNAYAGAETTTTTATMRKSGQRQASASASALAPTSTSSKKPTAKQDPEDVEMLDVPGTSSSSQERPRSAILKPHPLPSARPGDDDPLLVSRLPPLPSDDELRALLAAPPLSYLEARGTWPPGTGGDGQQYPRRTFCVVCGYWGRVRCMKCGTRVCALECLEIHQEECVTRYGL
ncbi:hypothetical protein F5B21DRAFT_501085 [Xylaria acuta]|nr:hypothetical protein F5B21DRAFT_501085 [Xylaria acuta]